MPIVDADFGLSAEWYTNASLYSPSENIDSLFPMLLPKLPNCPLDAVRDAVRGAANEFFRGSWAWRAFLAPITIVDGQAAYPMALGNQVELVSVLAVYTPTGQLSSVTMDALQRHFPAWQSAQGTPFCFNSLDYQNLTLYPTPVNTPVGTSYLVQVAKAPRSTIDDLDASLVQRHGDALIQGALADLWSMQDEAWSRPKQAEGARAEFLRQIDLAKITVLHERVHGNLVVAPVAFGRYP